jgi:tetratricopeptide (TPR) repeat protein
MPDAQYDAFISYASPDLAFAEEAQRRLTAAGFRVWFDQARLNPGCDWHREIEAGCEASRVLLPLLTPRWKLSDWTKFETYGAEAIIPLVVEGEFADIFTPPLTRFQGQAIKLDAADDAAWQRLFAALRSLLAQPAPDKLARLADVRYRANPYFVGREKELNQIHEELHQNPTAVLTQGRVRAVTALGGVGKTTLARQYLEKFWRCYPQIFWVDCRLGIETEFARLCDLLRPEQRASTNVVEKAQLALRTLESRDERLLVLDNAEDEASVQAWIPKTGHCRTLITSRFAGWSAAIKTIHLYVLEPEPAHTLLATRAGRESFAALTAAEQAECERLAKELGYLPLALEQAAAYIAQEGPGFGFGDYRRLYAAATAELLAEGVLGSTEYPDSVITTWKATTAKLSPAARGILRLCAFLSSARLPLSVLIAGVETLREEAAAVAGAPLPAVSQAEAWVRKERKRLSDYSMIEWDGQSLALHPLVQTVERLQLDEAARQATLKRSLNWIDGDFEGEPWDVRTWPALDPLAPHARAVAEYADQAGIFDPTARLMGSVGALFHTKAQYAEAEPLMRRSVEIFETSLGKGYPTVGAPLNNLAALLKATNRLAEAEPLMRQALAIAEQSFGPDHPNVSICLNNLALLLQDTNRLAEAEPLMRRALAIDERSFGPDHPSVARGLNILAQLLKATNRLAEAEPLMRRALAIDERSFGPDHPSVANSLSNLAQLLKATNRLAEAEPLMHRALAIAEQSFGPDHPNVSICLNNLALLLQAMNRLSEAEPLVRRALVIDERSFGPDHPNVANRLNNLATMLQAANRPAEAEPLMRRALAIDERSFGPDHPNVANRLNNLATMLQAANQPAEAEPLMRRALAIDERSFGPDHPRLTIGLNNLAQLLKATNRRAEAKPLLLHALKILEDFKRNTGHEHPNYLACRANLLSIQVARVLNKVFRYMLAYGILAFVVYIMWQMFQ